MIYYYFLLFSSVSLGVLYLPRTFAGVPKFSILSVFFSINYTFLIVLRTLFLLSFSVFAARFISNFFPTNRCLYCAIKTHAILYLYFTITNSLTHYKICNPWQYGIFHLIIFQSKTGSHYPPRPLFSKVINLCFIFNVSYHISHHHSHETVSDPSPRCTQSYFCSLQK